MLSVTDRLDGESPEEVILRATVSGSDRNALVERFC
jgi:hypothetical protein